MQINTNADHAISRQFERHCISISRAWNEISIPKMKKYSRVDTEIVNGA